MPFLAYLSSLSHLQILFYNGKIFYFSFFACLTLSNYQCRDQEKRRISPDQEEYLLHR